MEATEASERVEPLLERTSQLRLLTEARIAVESGRDAIVLIEGVAGVGKSSLLDRARREAADAGFLDLHGTGDELERSFSYGVVHQLFAGQARAGDGLNPELFGGAAALAMPLLDGTTPLPRDRVPAFRLLHGLHWLVASLAERSPLLLTIDDAQWADGPSLRFLLYLARRIEALPIAIVLAIRSGEALEPEVDDALGRLRALPGAAVIAPGPLGGGSVEALVRRALPNADAALVAAFHEATGGNPFLLRELLAAARESGTAEAPEVSELRPESIRNSILVRLRGMGPEAVRLASAVAVLGPAASMHAARRLARLDAGAAAAAADALLAAQILVSGDRYAFAHPVVREVVYAGLSEPRRRRDHGMAAKLLHEEGGGSSSEIATHVLLSDRCGERWVVEVLSEAAEGALQRGDAATATRILRRALEENGAARDPDLLLALGQAELFAREPCVIERLETARATARDPLQGARAAAALAHAHLLLGDSRRAFDAIRDALRRIPPGMGGASEAELFVWMLFSSRAVPSLVDETAALLAQPRTGAAGEGPPPVEVARRALVAFDAVFRGELGKAESELDWALANGGQLAEGVPTVVRSMIGACLWRVGRYRKAQSLLDRDLEETTRRGDLFELASCLEGRIGLAWARGDVNACLADIETMVGLDDEGWETATAIMHPVAAEMLLERDDPVAAAAALKPSEDVELRLPGTLGWVWLPYGRALLAMRSSDWPAAREQALAAGERLLELQIPSPDYFPWRSLAARAAARLGETERAESLAREELRLSRAAGSRKATGIALAALGAIQGGSEGVQLLEDAIAELSLTEAELAPARARLELGMVLRRNRRPRDARKPLEEALDIARGVGSLHVADRALGELRAAGGRPRRLALSGVESLTPGQLRVARMAADGLSNREIAEALFVTRRTVETHLTQAYGKLSITSREELPEAFERYAS
jgi:DNA-binding CsgD family transcriptional regulator